ncbi:PilZ domain-containing protein [Agrobacterium sp. a22-2]|uniref:PilZ domain-containing protein n=1 Tax=Agrobacterium sp. a22-2 TaxID=2283840 RepID=UPI00144785A2|nr:PilZ domain-containing protein [Agrobacterium sp. a22-2]NKN36656.1 PilZ domain-containing protein [Agrobacterium sp. a22-2]
MEERRTTTRSRALKAGRVVTNNGHSTHDCMVRNLSASGAKLVFETTIDIPDQFQLRLEDGVMRSCTVRWRKARDIGVSFDG